MYATCPKCGHQLPPGAAEAETCPACGIIFAKWLKQQLGTKPRTLQEITEDDGGPPSPAAWILERLLYTEDKVNPFNFAGRALVFAGLVVWGWYFISLDFVRDADALGASFMHRVHLVFHEFGHVFFRPFGWFMTILGGTLGQLLMPLLLAFAFLWKKNPFGAAVCTWWLGQSFMDCAPYIDDALVQQLMLLSGKTGADAPGNHDWNNILGELNMLERHREFATLADNTGTVLMLVAFAWGAVLLWRQYGNLDRF